MKYSKYLPYKVGLAELEHFQLSIKVRNFEEWSTDKNSYRRQVSNAMCCFLSAFVDKQICHLLYSLCLDFVPKALSKSLFETDFSCLHLINVQCPKFKG